MKTERVEETAWNNGHHCQRVARLPAATPRRSDKIGAAPLFLSEPAIHRRRRRGYLFTLFTVRRIRAIVLSVMAGISEGPTPATAFGAPAKGTSRVRGVKSPSRGWHEAAPVYPTPSLFRDRPKTDEYAQRADSDPSVYSIMTIMTRLYQRYALG